MEEILAGIGPSLAVIGLVILAFLVIEWIFLPFAIFGTKDKLNQLIALTKQTNEELRTLRTEITRLKRN